MNPVNINPASTGDILIVDDNISDLKLLSGILREAGYTVRPASDAELALRSVRARLPDLILIDINMPDLDGYEVCRRLKDSEDTRDIPLIFVSVRTSSLDKVKAFGVGSVDYVTKPFEPEEVLARVSTHLALWKAQKEIKEKNLQLQQEITGRVQAEEALQRERDFAESLIETAQAIVLVLDTEGRIVRFNPYMEEISGYRLEEVRDKDWFSTFSPKRNHDWVRELFLKAVGDIQTRGNVNSIVTKDGRERQIEWYDKTLKDADGNVVGLLAIGQEITERMLAEEDLWESEEKYRLLVKNIPSIVYKGYKDWSVDFFDEKIESLTGYDVDEFNSRRMKWIDIIVEEDIEAARGIFIQALKTDKSYLREYRIISKTGDINWIQERGQIICDNKGEIEYVNGTFFDITDSKQMQEERNRLAVAIEQAAESVFITDRNGTIQYVNPSFERVTGYSRKDAIGQNPRILKSGKHDASFYAEMWDTLTRGIAWHGRLINKKKGGSFYEADATISPVSDESGKITNFVSIKRDITHEIELEKRLIHAQKMESIGTLAGGIAHEFNNMLSIILGNAELAVDDVPDRSLAKECLDEIRSASLRASDVVRQILGFARKDVTEREPVQITPIIKNSLRLLRASIPTTIEISQDISCKFDTVLADSTKISQVLMNLCTNAAHAMSEHGGVLKVTLKNVEFENHDEELDVKAGRYVKLTVSDTGHGIEPTIADRIFDPYFTTKEVGKGTGMGLSVVHGIVKSCHGIITVHSEAGKGTVFQVLLPVIEGETELKVEKPDSLPTGTERILFVDDEPSLVKVARRTLERLGYEVETKINPIEALELFRSRPDRFDLVITDMTMPKMTGQKLVKEILNIRSDMPIILCTGYSEKISEEKAGELGINALVFKPFVARDFTLTVRKLLDAK